MARRDLFALLERARILVVERAYLLVGHRYVAIHRSIDQPFDLDLVFQLDAKVFRSESLLSQHDQKLLLGGKLTLYLIDHRVDRFGLDLDPSGGGALQEHPLCDQGLQDLLPDGGASFRCHLALGCEPALVQLRRDDSVELGAWDRLSIHGGHRVRDPDRCGVRAGGAGGRRCFATAAGKTGNRRYDQHERDR